jgi:hypothetical protein
MRHLSMAKRKTNIEIRKFLTPKGEVAKAKHLY